MVEKVIWEKTNLALENAIKLAPDKHSKNTIKKVMKHFVHINRKNYLKLIGLAMKKIRKKHKKFILFATRKNLTRRKK